MTVPPIINIPSVPQTKDGRIIITTDPSSAINVQQSWAHYTSVLLTTAGGTGQAIIGAGVTTFGFLLLLNLNNGLTAGWQVNVYDSVAAGAPPSTSQIDLLAVPSIGQAYRLYAIPSVSGGMKVVISVGTGLPNIRAILGWS